MNFKILFTILASISIISMMSLVQAREPNNIVDICWNINDKTILGGSSSYNEFLNNSKSMKDLVVVIWINGYISGMGSSFGSNKCEKRVSRCSAETSIKQKIVMIHNAAKENPNNWNEGNTFTTWVMLGFIHPCLSGDIPLNSSDK